MKTLIALFLALITFSFAAEEPQKDDPIVGVWRGFKSKRVIEILPDGTFVELPDGKKKKGEVVGRWKIVESKNAERKYQLIWFSGQHVHDMTIDRKSVV